MKVRLGFVSNSSTASYTLVGFDATGLLPKRIVLEGPDEFEKVDDNAVWDWIDELNEKLEGKNEHFRYLHGEDDGLYGDAEFVVGELISEVHSSGGQTIRKGPDLYKQAEERVKELAKELGVDNPVIEVYAGIRQA